MSKTSLLEQLAANILGQPIGDSMRTSALMAVARIAEMNDTGFDTNALFDHDYLTPRVASREGIFTITSLGKTGATYLVVLTERVGGVYQAAVQVYNPSMIGDGFYQMTLVRADNGTIRMNAGW